MHYLFVDALMGGLPHHSPLLPVSLVPVNLSYNCFQLMGGLLSLEEGMGNERLI